MKTIYKYPIQITDEQEIQVHGEADVLHAGLDPQGTPCIWAMVDPSQPTAPLSVLVVGTGNPMPYVPYRHLSSFVQGPFVWHVFLG
jgi:hypothetical protein